MKQYHSRLFFAASVVFCVAFTAPSVWASKAWYAEGVIRTDFRDTRISTTGCQGAALDESAGKVFFGTAPDATATAGIAQYSLLSLTRTEGIVEPDHVAQGVDTYGAMWGRSFGVAKGFVFSCSRSQTEKGKIEVRPYTTYSATEPTLVSLTGDLDGIANLELYPVTVDADGTSFYGCDASRLLKFTIGWNKDGSVASLTYAGSCALDRRPNAITVAAVGGRELVYAIAENDNKTASDLTILDVTDGAAMSVTSTATVSETGDAFGIAVSGIAAGMPHLTVAGTPKMKVLSLTADGTGVDVTTPVATFTTADFFPDAGVGIANRFGLAVTDDETRMFLSVSASQHLMVSAVMPPDWTIYVKATSKAAPVTPAAPYDTEATAAPDLNTAVAYANKLGLRKIKVVGTVPQTTVNVAIANVEVFGDGWDKAILSSNAGGTDSKTPMYVIGNNAFVHGIKFVKKDGSYQRAIFQLNGSDSVVSNCWINGIGTKTCMDGYGHPAGCATAGLITHCRFTGNSSSNGGGGATLGVNLFRLSGTARMRNSIFSGNTISGNSKGHLAGVMSLMGSAEMENCVVYGNYVVDNGNTTYTGRYCGGVFVRSGNPVIRNCIIRNNTMSAEGEKSTHSQEADIYVASSANPVVENCNFPEGQVPECAANCQTDNPKFTDADKDDFSIAADSPCVDAGLFQNWQANATDYSGVTPRYQGQGVDIGAYEVVNAETPVAIRDIELSGEVRGKERTATVRFFAYVTGPSLDIAYKWYTADPRKGAVEPIATGNGVDYVFENPGTYTIYLKAEDGTGSYPPAFGVAEQQVFIVQGADLYVSGTGSDDNDGTSIDAPFKTFEKAIETAKTMGGITKIRVVGTVAEIQNNYAIDNVEIFGEGRNGNDGIVITTEAKDRSNPYLVLGDNVLIHDLQITDSGAYLRAVVKLVSASSVVSNCWFRGLSSNAIYDGYGAIGGWAVNGLITHCLYTGLQSNNGGWGFIKLEGAAKMRNCIISGSRVDNCTRGSLCGSVRMAGTAQMENCVVYDNQSKDAGGSSNDRHTGGIYIAGDSPVIRNCIVRNNRMSAPGKTTKDADHYYVEADIYVAPGATPKISFCNITEGQVPEGAMNCQTGDPKFTDPDNATAADRDFSIAEDSPCVDAGNGRGWRKGATDYAGNPRIQGRRVDIGAYEYNSGVKDWGLQILVR